MPRTTCLFCLFAIAAIGLTGGLSSAAIVTADFQDGTTQDWEQGFPNGVSVLPDAGPAGIGDFALEAVPHPSRFRMFPHNEDTPGFVGDYVANGVTHVTFDAMNPTSSTNSFELHAVALNTDANRWVSNDAAMVPNDGMWRNYALSLVEADMTHAQGGNSFAVDFASIGQFGIRHQIGAADPGGTPLTDANNALLLDNIQLVPEPKPCDFSSDGFCDVTDLDLMQSLGPLAPGVPAVGNEEFDLNGDGSIDLTDRDQWLADAAIENSLASPYKLGDANIDGVVDGQDFIAWNGSKFTSDLLWSHGDWNADGVVDGQDFILWNGNKFTSSDGVSAVPEPAEGMLLIALLISLAAVRQR